MINKFRRLIPIVPLGELGIILILKVFLLVIIFRWQLKAWVGLYANIHMLLKLLMEGYFLTYVLDTSEPIVIVLFVPLMIVVSTWIARRSFD